MLTLLNQQASGGPGPCYVSIDPEGKNALVANYTGGSVAVLPIDADGKLRPASATDQHKGSGPDPKRQQGPFAHCFDLDPSHQFALACDLGMDKIFVYKFDAFRGSITPNDPPTASVAPGSGARHLAFHPGGKFVYVINEMGSTITAFAYDASKGALSEVQTVSTLPADFKADNTTCAEVAIHPNGKFAYGSNRGHDSIASFSVDEQTGKLAPTGHQSTGGKTPRHFAIAPGGEFLVAANQDSGNLVVFRIDPRTGTLNPTGMTAEVPSPVCVLFMPPG
jgi:6-phosphogluconolactonase